MNDRTFTFIDIYDDLLNSWRQDGCSHSYLDYTKTYTNNNIDFWADGVCVDCGRNTGNTMYWSV